MRSVEARALHISPHYTDGLRVLFVIPGAETGSSMIFAKRQAATISQLPGIITSVFFLESRTSLLSLVRAWRAIRHRIREFQPDLVHAQFGTMTAFFCAVSTSRPLVVTYFGSDLNPIRSGSRIRSLVGRVLSQLAALRSNAIICVSAQLRDRLWWRRDRVTVIPTPVDLQRFYPRPRAEVRRDLGWPENERVVLFNAGRDAVNKRLDLARAAVAKAAELVGETRLLVLEGSVAPDAMPPLMNAADCLVLTSDFEGSPTVVPEALACNLPVVSVDVGDVRARLQGVTHSQVVDRDPELLGTAIAVVLANRERSNGSTIIAQYSITTLAERITSVYRDAREVQAGEEHIDSAEV